MEDPILDDINTMADLAQELKAKALDDMDWWTSQALLWAQKAIEEAARTRYASRGGE